MAAVAVAMLLAWRHRERLPMHIATTNADSTDLVFFRNANGNASEGNWRQWKEHVAAERGVKTFHLGKGEAPYKRSLMTHAIPLATGAVERQRIATTVRRGYRGARNWVRTSAFSNLADLPAQIVRPVREWVSFR